jgi:RNA polymerase sigma factor (sigma-70 family)
MTDLLSDVETPSDAELISRVRGGDVAAYGELFSRHKDAANRLARQLVRGPDSDDLVADAFAKVLTVLQGGGGPDVSFRAYLLTAVRRLHVDRVRTTSRLQSTDDMTPFDPGVPFQDTAVAGFESGAAAKAFASLPERWQLVLWHLEVEGQKPADIAPLLGMSANSVSALAYRAREGLRQAFLTMHLSDLSDTDCRWVTEHLGAYVRKGLSNRDSVKVRDHLDDCRRCTAMYLELTEVNSNLAGIIAPLLLGAAATGYLASGGAGAVGVLGVFSKAKEFVGANAGAAAAAGVTAAVVAAAVAAVTLSGGGDKKPDPVADGLPTSITSAGSPSAGATAPSAATSPRSTSSSGPSASSSASALASPAAGLLSAQGTPAPSASALLPPLAPIVETPATEIPGVDGGTSPGAEPTAPAAVSEVSIDGTQVTDDGVLLRAAGSPQLPQTLTVHLTSQPAGVRFAGNTDPQCSVVNPITVTCETADNVAGA